MNFDSTTLYSFVHIPTTINMNFLGIIDISKVHLLVLAILAGISQYFQAYYMPKPAPSSGGDKDSFQENFARSMQTQMKYVFPFVVAFIAYSVSGAIALYWIVSNVFAIGQQIYAKNKSKKALLVK